MRKSHELAHIILKKRQRDMVSFMIAKVNERRFHLDLSIVTQDVGFLFLLIK